jgi:hypothetical protein
MRLLAVLAAAIGSVAMANGSAAAGTVAHATRPVIVSIHASPMQLPASGAPVTVTVRVMNAARCTFLGQRIAFSSLYVVKTIPCGTGIVHATLPRIDNSYGGVVHMTYAVRATGAEGSSVEKTVRVIQRGGAPAAPAPVAPAPATPSPPPPPVVGLNACVAGPHCFYGPIYGTYLDYGNVAPANLGDCTFAAAADWEQILLGIHPDPTVIGFEFAQAGGSAVSGLPAANFFSYWTQYGIAGVRLTGLHPYFTDQTDVENGVRDFAALLVEFKFGDGFGFAQYTMNAGNHMAVVDGFTPRGPLIVTWGHTLQMTWEQWNAEVISMWGISTG